MPVWRDDDVAASLTFSRYRRGHCSATKRSEEATDLSWPVPFANGGVQAHCVWPGMR